MARFAEHARAPSIQASVSVMCNFSLKELAMTLKTTLRTLSFVMVASVSSVALAQGPGSVNPATSSSGAMPQDQGSAMPSGKAGPVETAPGASGSLPSGATRSGDAASSVSGTSGSSDTSGSSGAGYGGTSGASGDTPTPAGSDANPANKPDTKDSVKEKNPARKSSDDTSGSTTSGSSTGDTSSGSGATSPSSGASGDTPTSAGSDANPVNTPNTKESDKK